MPYMDGMVILCISPAASCLFHVYPPSPRQLQRLPTLLEGPTLGSFVSIGSHHAFQDV